MVVSIKGKPFEMTSAGKPYLIEFDQQSNDEMMIILKLEKFLLLSQDASRLDNDFGQLVDITFCQRFALGGR